MKKFASPGHFLSFFLILNIVMVLILAGCDNSNGDDPPLAYIDITILPNSTLYQELNVVGGWMYLGEQDGVEAVFVPDYAATAIVLATQLRSAVPDLVLLGSNGWNDPKQLARAGAEVEGAVFVDGFFAGSERAPTRTFMTAYQAEYGAVPGILEAQAYDAATLLRRALETGVRSRAAVVPRLRLLGSIDGAGGRIVFGPEGVDRQVFLLTLRGGMVREIAPVRTGSAR